MAYEFREYQNERKDGLRGNEKKILPQLAMRFCTCGNNQLKPRDKAMKVTFVPKQICSSRKSQIPIYEDG